MRGMRQNARRAASLTAASMALAVVVVGCGGGGTHFKNKPRPPVPTQLTGVITKQQVTVSPDTVPLPPPKGQQETSNDLDTPIILIISNQTQVPHTVTLTGKTRDGKTIEANTPPINPLDT